MLKKILANFIKNRIGNALFSALAGSGILIMVMVIYFWAIYQMISEKKT